MIEKEMVFSKLKTLKMTGSIFELDEIIRSASDGNYNYLQFLMQILDAEIKARDNAKIKRRIAMANFPVIKNIADFDFSIRPDIKKHEILSFCNGSFLEKKENIIFIGNPGTGKTHLSIAIAYQLCLLDKSVLFTTATKLANALTEARDEKALSNYLKKASKLDLVVIDEMGYFPFEKNESELIFQFISERYERGSMIITTNLSFASWNEIFHTQRLTTAILDRLVHFCNIIEVKGESYRFTNAKEINKSKIKGGNNNNNRSEK